MPGAPLGACCWMFTKEHWLSKQFYPAPTSAMRILFVAPYVPSLIRVRPYQWVKSLTALGHTVTVVALGTDGAARDEEAHAALSPICEAVHVVPHSRFQAALHCALSLPTPTPLWAAYCRSKAMGRALRGLLRAQTFDVAHVEHLRAAHFARVLTGRLPLVFDAVDCLTDLQRQMRHAPGRSFLPRLVSWEEECKLRRYEPRLAALFHQTLITSAHDADAFRALAHAAGLTLPLSVVPNGVDLDYFQSPADAVRAPRNILFSGKMSYAANHDAALYFVREIWPLVRKSYPDATLTLAGSGPRADLLALGALPASGIHVTGHVPDLRPFLAQASVAVCPLRIGVGIQNKALEAMAMGLPVVATPLAARALPPDAPGRLLRTAQTPAEFAHAIADLLARPDDARQMGLAARRYVETHHNWHILTEQLTILYQNAIKAFSVQRQAQ